MLANVLYKITVQLTFEKLCWTQELVLDSLAMYQAVSSALDQIHRVFLPRTDEAVEEGGDGGGGEKGEGGGGGGEGGGGGGGGGEGGGGGDGGEEVGRGEKGGREISRHRCTGLIMSNISCTYIYACSYV